MTTEKKAKTATRRWPRKPGYYWMYSLDYDAWLIVEVSGSHYHKTQCFYFLGGDNRPKARSWIEQKHGFACEWLGPLEPPRRAV